MLLLKRPERWGPHGSHRSARPSALPGDADPRFASGARVRLRLPQFRWANLNWTFYEVCGLFRLAVIAQQIYYRYHHRQTRNPAFKNFWVLVNYLGLRCDRLIRKKGAR